MKRQLKSLREILWEDKVARSFLLGSVATMTAFCVPFAISMSNSFRNAAQAKDAAREIKPPVLDRDVVPAPLPAPAPVSCPPAPGETITRHEIKAVTHDGLELSFAVYASINTSDPRDHDYPTLWNKNTPLSAANRDKVVTGGVQKILSGYDAWEIDTTGQIGRVVRKLSQGKTGPVAFALKPPQKLIVNIEREMANQISGLRLNKAYPDLPFTLRVEDGEMRASAPRDKIRRMTKPKGYPKDLPPRL
jgi:hypothetical protein